MNQPKKPLRYAAFESVRHTQAGDSFTFENLKVLAETPHILKPANDSKQAIQQAKNRLAVLAPHGAPEKQKQAVQQHNQMNMLWIDIDAGNHSLSGILAQLHTLEIQSYIVHSTYTATAENRKWRVLIEISQSLDVVTWQKMQKALVKLFPGADEAATRIQQIMFLPAKQSNEAFYQYHLGNGQPWEVSQ